MIDSVKNAIERMTGMCVMDVSMFVEDVVFPCETEGSDKEESMRHSLIRLEHQTVGLGLYEA